MKIAVRILLAAVLMSCLQLNSAHAGNQCVDVFNSAPASAGVPMTFVKSMLKKRLSETRRAIQKAITGWGLGKFIQDKTPLRNHDNNMTFVLPEGTIKDQQQSGRCWIFASLTAIENHFLGSGKLMPDAEFSRTYIQFFNMLERSNSYIDSVINLRKNSTRIGNQTILNKLNPKIADGGYVEDIIFLIQKYGLVPTSAMPETVNSLNTAALLEELNGYLQNKSYELWELSESFKAGATPLHDRILTGQTENTKRYDKTNLEKLTDEQIAQLEAKKEQILAGVWKILEQSLGTPPSDFQIKVPLQNSAKNDVKILKFEPTAFVNDYLEFNPADWINVSNLRNRERGRVYRVKYNDMNRAILRLNLPPERMIELVKAQLLAGMPVPFDSNYGPGVNLRNGDLMPGTDKTRGIYGFKNGEVPANLSLSQKDMLGQLTADHETVFMGFDQPQGYSAPIQLLGENSWNTNVLNGGNFNVRTEWFDQLVDGIMIHASVLSPEEREMLKQPTIELKAINE